MLPLLSNSFVPDEEEEEEEDEEGEGEEGCNGLRAGGETLIVQLDNALHRKPDDGCCCLCLLDAFCRHRP